MSSTAAAPARASKPKISRPPSARESRAGGAWPEWTRKHKARPEQFLGAPREYYSPALQAACTYLAYRIILLYAVTTYDIYGKRWLWMDKKSKEIAAELGVSEDGVDGALMELRKSGFFEGKDLGNQVLYRAIEENFPLGTPKRKPAASEEDARAAVREESTQDDENEEKPKNEFAESSPMNFQQRTFRILRGRHTHRSKVGFFVERFEHESDCEAEGFASLSFHHGTLRLHSRIGGAEKPPGAGPAPGDDAVPVKGDKFPIFMDNCARAELPACRSDWERARKAWNKLTLEQQLLAIKGIEERIECGEFTNPRFRPKPQNYLDFAWERPLRPAEKGKGGSEGRKSFYEALREVDRRRR